MQSRADALTFINWKVVNRPGEPGDWCGIFSGGWIIDRSFDPLFRRFFCACCRHFHHRMTADVRQALDEIEAFAYSRGSFSELIEARKSARLAARRFSKNGDFRQYNAACDVGNAAQNSLFLAISFCGHSQDVPHKQQMAEIYMRVAHEWIAEERNE